MRALKVAVVVMGVLIVGGVIVLFTVLAQRMSSGSGPIASAVLDEPAGTRIAGTSTAPDRLVVQLQGGGPFAWRKKWAKTWDEVRFCSDACRTGKRDAARRTQGKEG